MNFNFKENYLELLVDFLCEYRYLFEVSNTQYLKCNVLEKIPVEWFNYYQESGGLDDLDQCPEPFKTFLEAIESLQLEFEVVEEQTFSRSSKIFKKMSIKKQYEIVNLSEVIHKLCTDEVDLLVDFGSGLGYLSNQILQLNKNFKILGLEADESRVETSIKRIEENFPDITEKVNYAQHFITESSDSLIREYTKDQTENIAIIGLHACADLTITAINLFFKMQEVKKLIIMPCCYHKLCPSNEECTKFVNFPLSQKLKSSTLKFIGRPFLRLACQQPSTRWNFDKSKRFQDGKSMFERAVVEALLEDHQTVQKTKTPKVLNNERLTFEDVCNHYQLMDKISKEKIEWNQNHSEKFEAMRTKHQHGEKYSDFLTFLQSKLQVLCENLVLIDRLYYMEEMGKLQKLNTKISVKKLSNNSLSPRCYILIGEKFKFS